MSTKDTAKDILSGVISDAVERKESETSKLEDIINLSTSQITVIRGYRRDRSETIKLDSNDDIVLKE